MPPKDADPLMLGGLEPEAIVAAVNDKKVKKKPEPTEFEKAKEERLNMKEKSISFVQIIP